MIATAGGRRQPKHTPATAGTCAEVADERAYGERRYGNGADDRCHIPRDWLELIASRSMRGTPTGLPPYSRDTLAAFRRSMVKTAALAVAAIEWVDRRTAASNRA